MARENGYQEMMGMARRGREGQKYPLLFYRNNEPLYNMLEYWRQGGGEEQQLEVLIQPEHMTKENKRVKSRQIWGDLVYTPDSDLVAVLMHLGYYAHSLQHPPQSVVEVRVIIRLMQPQDSYPSKARFVKSRAWSRRSEGCSFKVERCWLVTRTGCIVELSPCIDELPAAQATVQPQTSDRQISTRNTAAGAKAKQAQEVSVQYSLCNEPWLKYTLAAVADKGLKPSAWTSSRLLDEVLYLETVSQRYQIARTGVALLPAAGQEEAGGSVSKQDVFSFSRVKTPMPSGVMRRLGVPLPAEQVELLHSGVAWEELQWGVNSLHVRGTEIRLRRMSFMRCTRPEDVPM